MTKSTNVIVRVSEDDRKKMHKVAKSYGMSLSEFVRAFTQYVVDYRPRLVIEPRQESEDGS